MINFIAIVGSQISWIVGNKQETMDYYANDLYHVTTYCNKGLGIPDKLKNMS